MNRKRLSVVLWVSTAALSAPASAQGQGGGPYYKPSGFDLTATDPATKPGNDFFQYANGAYLARSVIPADRPVVSRRFEMTDRMEAQLHALLQDVSRNVGEQPA